MRTIRVTGKGQIKVKPDMTRITMTLTGVCKEYGEMLLMSFMLSNPPVIPIRNISAKVLRPSLFPL